MKRIFLIGLFGIACCMTCTNDEQKKDPVSQPSNNAATDTGSRGDTASYERMPQQTGDSIRK